MTRLIFAAFAALWLLMPDAWAQASKTQMTPKPPPSPGEKGYVFRDCPECPEMVVVPKGIYIMGLGGTSRHGPPHRVNIKKPFSIGRY
ncbi:MAG: hypothetical protein VW405_11670, partial [Rhodospirillaceae bacterium]